MRLCSPIPGNQGRLWGQRCAEAGTSAYDLRQESYDLVGERIDVPEMGWDRILTHGHRLERPWEKCIKANKELMMALVDGQQFWDVHIKKYWIF